MKDLDRTQVYDLRGITEKQVKELLEWLKDNDRGWDIYNHYRIMEYRSLEYIRPEWMLGDREPTTHISTLFEQSYEQQLQEAKKKLERYKKEVERLENGSKPKVDDVCQFWDYDESGFVIGILTDMASGDFPYQDGIGGWFKHAKKLTEQEVIDLLFKKS